MTYSFRLHGFMGDRARLNVDGSRLSLWTDGASREVVIRAADEAPLCETGDLIVEGSGWATEEVAATAGERWKSAIVFGFAHHAIAMSLGTREKPWSEMSPAGVQAVREMLGIDPSIRITDDQLGIVTFRTNPPIQSVRMTARAHKRPSTDRLIESLQAAIQSGVVASPQQLLAFELYNQSLSIDTPDIRFVCLMMGIECLIEFESRPADMQEIVRAAMEQAGQLDDGPDRQSFIGSLRYLMNESISSAGQHLARSLDRRITYMGEAPEQFFRRCYSIRSALVHGTGSAPTPDEVDVRAASLEIMVGDLLSVPILGYQTGREPGAAPP